MTDGSMLDVHRPVSGLADLVECCWGGRSDGRRGVRELVLPTGATSLVFSIDDGGRIAGVVTGPHSRAITLDTSRAFAAVGVKFRIGGAFPFFSAPGGELHNQVVDADDLWRVNVDSLADKVWEAQSLAEKIGVIQRALLEQLSRAPSRHPAVDFALREIDRSGGGCRIRGLADTVGISTRRLGQLFEREVGLPPKLFAGMRRFGEVLRLLESPGQLDLTTVALSSGYYDQAHFNHEFRRFAGMDPSAYRARRLSPTHVSVDG
jgi:methylphosphotriester-DNA--protein-cysteine methyltransferase